MKPVKFEGIEIRKPRYNPHPEKSKTNNSKWRVGFFIVFEDYLGNKYDYMPKWNELELFNEARKEVERQNKELAKEAMKNENKKS